MAKLIDDKYRLFPVYLYIKYRLQRVILLENNVIGYNKGKVVRDIPSNINKYTIAEELIFREFKALIDPHPNMDYQDIVKYILVREFNGTYEDFWDLFIKSNENRFAEIIEIPKSWLLLKFTPMDKKRFAEVCKFFGPIVCSWKGLEIIVKGVVDLFNDPNFRDTEKNEEEVPIGKGYLRRSPSAVLVLVLVGKNKTITYKIHREGTQYRIKEKKFNTYKEASNEIIK